MKKVFILLLVVGFLMVGTLSTAEELSEISCEHGVSDSEWFENPEHGNPVPLGGGGSGGGGEGGAPG